MPILATVAVALYYWFAAPLIASGLGLSDVATLAIRVAALALVAFWTTRGLLSRSRS